MVLNGNGRGLEKKILEEFVLSVFAHIKYFMDDVNDSDVN